MMIAVISFIVALTVACVLLGFVGHVLTLRVHGRHAAEIERRNAELIRRNRLNARVGDTDG